jgi:hypothetical protein
LGDSQDRPYCVAGVNGGFCHWRDAERAFEPCTEFPRHFSQEMHRRPHAAGRVRSTFMSFTHSAMSACIRRREATAAFP